MTTALNWQDFLESLALATDSRCLQTANPQHALLRVTGTDAESFLHAQFSNSVTGLSTGEVRLAAWCNAKGRVWTLLQYCKQDDAFILRLPADQLEATLKRLRMFVLRSDVQLEPMNWQATQFLGPDATEQAAMQAQSMESQTFNIPLLAAWPLHEVWSPESSPASSAESGTAAVLSLPRMLAGAPDIPAVQREAWIPQMLNLDHLGGIDFKKGCYPGQEIVAKLHYKGGLKQRLILARIDKGASAPEINETLHDSEGSKVATIIEVASTLSDHWLLAVARIEALDSYMLHHQQPVTIVDIE